MAHLCHVLLSDPDLGAGLSDGQLARARRECIAPEVIVDTGYWRPEEVEGEELEEGELPEGEEAVAEGEEAPAEGEAGEESAGEQETTEE